MIFFHKLFNIQGINLKFIMTKCIKTDLIIHYAMNLKFLKILERYIVCFSVAHFCFRNKDTIKIT